MTQQEILDQFAAAAMVAVCVNRQPGESLAYSEIAQQAYDMAESMLRERYRRYPHTIPLTH